MAVSPLSCVSPTSLFLSLLGNWCHLKHVGVVSNAPRLPSFGFIQVYRAFHITILIMRRLTTQAYNFVLKRHCRSVDAYTNMTIRAHIVDPIRHGLRRVVAITGELSDPLFSRSSGPSNETKKTITERAG